MRVCVWFSAVGTVSNQQVLFSNSRLYSGMGPQQSELLPLPTEEVIHSTEYFVTTIGALVDDGIIEPLPLPGNTVAWFYDGTATTGEGVTAVFVEF